MKKLWTAIWVLYFGLFVGTVGTWISALLWAKPIRKTFNETHYLWDAVFLLAIALSCATVLLLFLLVIWAIFLWVNKKNAESYIVRAQMVHDMPKHPKQEKESFWRSVGILTAVNLFVMLIVGLVGGSLGFAKGWRKAKGGKSV